MMEVEVEHKESKGELLQKKLEDIRALEETDVEEAIKRYKAIIALVDEDGEIVAEKTAAIYALGELYAQKGRHQDLRNFIVDTRPFFSTIAKAKTAKILKELLNIFGRIPETEKLQAEFCKDTILWCEKEGRSFLKQRVQARLASLLLGMQQYKDALALINKLVKDVKKIDDKILLVEISIIESRIHLALKNVPKAKGSLTAARSAANAIYCPPSLQAEIDIQSGVLCSEEGDYKTAYSYFFEGFEGFDSSKNVVKAAQCLKYMLMVKIMTNQSADVYNLINTKVGVKYAGTEIEAIKAIADAHKKRSIHKFADVKEKYANELSKDWFISAHLDALQDNLLVQNLLRIIEPFSRVEITHVASLIDLPRAQVEAKLSEMVLEKKLNGILDQGSGDLIVFDEVPEDKTFKAGLETLAELNNVVDKLYAKARRAVA
eukprot:CAMPEP_0167790572 /NCGR_PEP_ID=MMETSP0111_2-20121227/11411_1 /TAXON_ID=91324 /ORGANISM="Lotharella globosa, Strain CCCM811" /LENGTH=432 /DNA_ID=CAMNT_0007683057 /DNA_START=20 /DNA_END=1318 /DNA_ORIENTATION=-